MTVRYCALTAVNWPSASEIGRISAVGPAFQGRCIFWHLGIWKIPRDPGSHPTRRPRFTPHPAADTNGRNPP